MSRAFTNTAPGSAGQNGAHTPGPWTKDKRGQLRGPEGQQVGVWDAGIAWVSRDGEAEANARLIAAAPQMLEALREALPTFEERAAYFGIESGPLIAIRAAIAAATGEEG